MTLYEIDKNIKEVIEQGFTVDEDGVVVFEQEDLDSLQAQLEDKLENIALYIKNTLAEVNAIKAEETILAERRKAKENKAERLKEYMQSYLEQQGRKKFETTKVVASIRESEAVEVAEDAVEKLPLGYVTVKTEMKPDKKALKKALKDGVEIAGVKLVKNKNLNIK